MKGAARMRPTAQQDLLLRAAFHPDLDVARRAAGEWSAGVDLDTLDHTSLQLLPLLAARPDPLPLDAQLAEQVNKVARMTWLRTALLSQQTAPAIGRLAEAGFEPVLMKGAALVHAHGVPPRLRPMFDIDVLVAREDTPAAAEILDLAGFVARDGAVLRAGEPRILNLKHGEEFRRGDNASIDLHWSALQTIRRPELFAALRENVVPASLGSIECSALGVADTLAVTIEHAADSWRDIRERWVADCVQLVRGHADDLDWELLASRARDWRIARQTLDAFDYLEDVAAVALPALQRRQLERARTPLAVRIRRARGERWSSDGRPATTGRATRLIDDYESEIADRVPFGASTGPADFARYLAGRWGLDSPTQVPAEAVFVAAGRPWRTRRRLREAARLGPRAERCGWPVYEPGETLRFSGNSPGTEHLGSGWWFPEDFGIWSRGEFSRVHLGGTPPPGDAELSVGVFAPLAEQHPSLRFDVIVNEHRLARIPMTLEETGAVHRLRVPAEALAGRDGVEIAFVVHDTVVPAELALAPDMREIGIGLSELTLRPLAA